MGIISISRIQLRRGLKVDLPANLYEGELGWVLDTRELFIGNGDTFNGNTELLTQYSPNDQLITHSYQGSTSIPTTTGIYPSLQTLRSIGAILDDFLNIKDYGAFGDGITDDTEAIQNAINDTWNINANNPGGQASLKIIYFPAGNYLISNTIYVRPYIGLVGEGINNTIFIMGTMANNPTNVISTADSLGQTYSSIGTNSAIMPNGILLKGFKINTSISANLNGILLVRSSYSQIDSVQIVGAWQSGQNPLVNNTYPFTSGIKIQTLGSLAQCDQINITNYYAQNMASGFYCNDIARYLVLDKVNITNCFRGVVIEQNNTYSTNGPSYVRITNSTFKQIDNHGIQSNAPNCGLVSANNAFDTVGVVDSVTPILFTSNTKYCSSINDTFSNTSGNLISIGNQYTNLFISPQQVSIPSNIPIPFGPFTLLDNSTNLYTGISYNCQIFNTIFINYNITRGSAIRSGKLILVTNGTNVDFDDNNIDLNTSLYGSVGVNWSANVVANTVNLNYTTTSTGLNASLTYIETKW